jgi:hypothetical protein
VPLYCAGLTFFKKPEKNHAVEKVFHGIQPNVHGRVVLTFEPIVNYAPAQAFELVEEGR